MIYVAKGGMTLVQDGQIRPLKSQRIAQYERTMRVLEEKHEWKSIGQGAQFMGQHNPYAGASAQKGTVTAAAPYRAELLYAFLTGQTGGLYLKNPLDDEQTEGLVLSSQTFQANDLCTRGQLIAASLNDIRMEKHIVLFKDAQSGYTQLTEGDSVDRYPFIAKDAQTLYYSSAGHARNAEDALIATSPYAVLSLTLSTGNVETVYEDAGRDCLKYMADETGGQYFLSRPYKQPARPGVLDRLKNLLMIPVYIFKGLALFGKMTKAAGGGDTPRPAFSGGAGAKQREKQEVMIEGQLLDIAQQLHENEQRGEKYPGIVPKDWQLVRLKNDGSLETIKHGVLDYALLPSGGFVYTNGKYVIAVDTRGGETVLAKDTLITKVAVLAAE